MGLLKALQDRCVADVSVFDRARQDEANGDLASAKNRLASHAAGARLDPAVCEQIARLCVRMQDPCEAGRWYFLCDSADSEASRCIERFTRSCGTRPRQILSQLPRATKSKMLDEFPPAAAARLRDLGFAARPAKPAPVAARWKVVAVGGMWLLVAAWILVCAIIGMSRVRNWIFG